MANIMKDAAYMALPMNIKRGNPIPLDTTAVWYDKTEMETYAQSGATAYVGQILTFYGDVPVGDTGTTEKVCEAYMITSETGTLVKLAQTTASGDLAKDVTNLQTAVANCLRSIESSDNSIDVQITDIAGNGGKQADIKVRLSATKPNSLELKDDGLYVPTPTIPTVPVYTLKKDTTASSGASATYHLLKDNVKVGDAIDIPKDMVVESGAVKTYATKTEATNDGMPADQANKGTFPGTFIKLTIANKTSDSLFINAGGLIEYVTSGSESGDMIVIEVSKDHKVTGTISDKTITKEKLIEAVQTSLGKADSAVQTVETGATNGHIKVDGTDVKVKGLNTAAYTTVDTLNATAQGYATTAKTEAETYTNNRIGTLGKVGDTQTDHTVKTYVDAQTTTINNSISTINNTLTGKADTATTLAGYGITDAYTKNEAKAEIDANSTADQAYADGIVGTAKEVLIGATGDSADKDTIHGAKKYADSKASTAESNAKTYADGLVSDTSAIGVKVKALEDTHAKVGGTGEDKDKFKTVAQEVQAGITALDLDNTYAKKTELPTFDGKSIAKNGSKVEINGFTDANNATFPQKKDGMIHWVPASEMSVATDGKTITKDGSNQLTLAGNFASIETATKGTEYLFPRIMSDNTLKWTSIRPMVGLEFEKFEDGTIAEGVEGIGIALQGRKNATNGALPYKTQTGLEWKLLAEVDTKSLETTGGNESTPAKYQLKGFGTATNGQEPRINIDDGGNRTLTWVDNKDQAITDLNTKFGNYYTKKETYTQTEVDNAIKTKVASTYKPAGSIDAEAVSKFTPAEKYLGNVYNVSEQFNTTANFIEGAGKTYPAGTNIVVVKAVDNSYKFDVLAGFVDLSPYAKTADINTELDKKVDTVEGKGLSANDFTDALKTKLDGIDTGAQVNYIKSVDTQFTVDAAGKLTLNAIAPTKITGIDAYANKIETVKVGTTALEITDKTVTIPGATASALGVVKSSAKLNDVTVNADFTMTVNKISTDKLEQGQNTIIWNGGNASTT